MTAGRCVFAWLLVAAVGILYGYVRVATKAWWSSPALLLLAVMVPPVVVNFWLRIGRPRLTLAPSGHHRAPTATAPDRGRFPAELRRAGRGAGQHLPLRQRHALARHARRSTCSTTRPARRCAPWPSATASATWCAPDRGELRKAGNLIHAFGLSDGRVHRGDRRRLRGAARFPVRDDALHGRPEGRCRPDRPVLRHPRPVVPLYPALCRGPAGDLLPLHPARQGPLQGGDLRRDQPGLPAHRRRGGRRFRPGADRRGRALRREAVVGRLRDPVRARCAWPRGSRRPTSRRWPTSRPAGAARRCC